MPTCSSSPRCHCGGDYSRLKALFDKWRAEGVTDLRDYLREDPKRIKVCSDSLRIVKVNRRTLTMFEADDLPHLAGKSGSDPARRYVRCPHRARLVQLWDGELAFSSNTVNYSLLGRRIDIQLKGSILPGYEDTWERVLVSVEDVTERENARRELSNR